MMVRLFITIIALFGISTASLAITVEEIVAQANHVSYYQGQDGKAKVAMTITDGQGRKREREFTILRRNVTEEDGGQKFYVYFRQPADVAKTAFLVWKKVGADDDRWLYLRLTL